MRRCVVGLASFALSFIMSGLVFGAELTARLDQLSGKVLVNQGDGFAKPKEGIVLRFGDRVLIGSHARVMVKFESAGCSVTYSDAKLLRIPKVAPCKLGEDVAAVDSAFVSPAGIVVPFPAIFSPAGVGLGVEAGVFGITGYKTYLEQPVTSPP